MASISNFFDSMHGMLFPFAGTVAPPGFLMCDGKEYSRTTYAALFAAIGTAHGAGDGVTTFNVPDARGRTLAGMDNMGGTAANRLTTSGSGVDGSTLGASGGAETHTLTQQQMPAHSHSDSRYTGATGGAGTPATGTGSTAVIGTGSSSTVGNGLAHNNTQPTLVLNWVIKT